MLGEELRQRRLLFLQLLLDAILLAIEELLGHLGLLAVAPRVLDDERVGQLRGHVLDALGILPFEAEAEGVAVLDAKGDVLAHLVDGVDHAAVVDELGDRAWRW